MPSFFFAANCTDMASLYRIKDDLFVQLSSTNSFAERFVMKMN